MNKNQIIKKLKEKRDYLKEKGVRKIGVFGSYAKEKQNKKSDIDLIVDLEKINFKDYMDLLFYLKKLFNTEIDLVIEKDLKPELKYIKKEAEYVKI